MKLVVSNNKRDVELLKAATHRFQVRCGAFFRAKRILRDRSEEDVAEFLKISVQTLRDYESGKEAIPLYRVDGLSIYLEIPPEEIMELHLDLEKKIMPKPPFEERFAEGRDVGKVVHQARKTVFLSPSSLARLLSRSGDEISEEEVLQIENGTKPASLKFWESFCALVHLSVDSVEGYSRLEHLTRISDGLKNNSLRFPVGSKLLIALESYQIAHEVNEYKVSYLLNFCLSFRRR